MQMEEFVPNVPRQLVNSGNCKNGCDAPQHCRQMCKRCYGNERYYAVERQRRGAVSNRRMIGDVKYNHDGYVMEYVGKDYPNSTKGWILQHRKVMQEILNRPLFSGENVHHKNAVKTDNRPENLELWNTSQPKGARVSDLLEYAEWILKTYG